MVLSTVKSAVGAAFLRIGIYVSCAACQGTYRIQDGGKGAKHHAKTIFSKVMELDAGGIEKIGPTSAITAAVDAVEQMQAYLAAICRA